jgi:glycosyltransferase involved in cell wall biosynthesis
MRILLWHVHGGWTDAFVRGPHDYLLPTAPDGSGGRGTRPWPDSVVDVPLDDLRDADVDVVVLQRTEELELVEQLLGRRPGTDLPAVFVEHNTPRVDVPSSVHPLADQDDVLVVHVTHFNRLFWDCGRAPTTVVEHGVVDPGPLYTGEERAVGVVTNEPVRRWRVTGAERLGVDAGAVVAAGDLPTDQLHRELARRRLYLHTPRWTSLGLSLLEAMHLGMPVVGVDTTEIRRAVPPEAGVLSNDLGVLHAAVATLLDDPDEARARGVRARAWALTHYGLEAFLDRWDAVLDDVVSHASRSRASAATSSTPTPSTKDGSWSHRASAGAT